MGAWPEVAPHWAGFTTITSLSLECYQGLALNAGYNDGSAAWPTANLGLFLPIRLTYPFLVVAAIVANGTAVSGNFDVGLYTEGGTRLTSIGSTAQAGTSTNQRVALGTPYLLAPGSYYLGIAVDNTTAQVHRYAPAQLGFAQLGGILQAATVFALPASVTYAALTNAYIPRVGISGRSF
jgi:hypothetical protein